MPAAPTTPTSATAALLDWFESRGWTPFPYQQQTWDAYACGGEGLVHAPTGTGKTYAVWCGPLLDWLSERGPESRDGEAPPLRVLWITPLRALASDTLEALRAPLEALGLPWTLERRTGDTPQSVRQRQRRRLPTALITTPESLSLLLSYPESERQLRTLSCIVIDEWHELMGSKRGVQAELGLAALRRIAPAARTWGLSATLGNLEEAMETLLGVDRGERPRHLVHAELPKVVELETVLPDSVERFPWAGHIGTRLLPEVISAIHRARSTLVFTNTRSQAESWFQSILTAAPDLLGEVALHHGSLDRNVRGEVEHRLRDGRLRAVVCTSSLDLGVDFSPVEQVIQIGSPKGIARTLQRAGRSGHRPGARSRLLGVPTNALEIIEFAAAREAMKARRVEVRAPVIRPMDVLVQHLVTRALGGGFDEAVLREEVRSTHAFAAMTDEQWGWAMEFVTRGGRALTAYPQFARVEQRDGRCVVAAPRIGRLHRMSIGTITSDPSVTVRFQRGSSLGTIEESFVSRLRPGDRFVFAGRVVELVRFRDMTATVRAAGRSAKGTIPRWMGGRSPLSSRLAAAVRAKLDEARRGTAGGREMQVVAPLLELQQEWSIIPAPDELLLEHTRSRDGHHVFVFSLEGRLVHEGLGALLAHRLAQRAARSITVSGNDYGVELLSPTPLPVAEEDWRDLLSTDALLEDLLRCVNGSELARRRFRDIARVAGLIFPGYPGQRKALRHLQASSELFYDVFTEFDPQNLLLEQARREVLERELEVRRLRGALDRLAAQSLRIIPTRPFSPLAFPLWAERIRSQHVSSESWTGRIQRMVETLEQEAGAATDEATT